MLSSIQTHAIATQGLSQEGVQTGCHKPAQHHAGLGTVSLGTPSPGGSVEEAHLWLDTDDEHADLYKVRGFPNGVEWRKTTLKGEKKNPHFEDRNLKMYYKIGGWEK